MTADTCADTTVFRVTESVVDVRDFVRNRTVAVRAGQTYVAGRPTRRLTGPSRVKVGSMVSFRATGLGGQVSVTMQPLENVGGNGAGASAGKLFRADVFGETAIRYRWPTRYFRCAGARNCTAYPWPKGARVQVAACGASGGCVRKTVRLSR
jgi:hypothetical protein